MEFPPPLLPLPLDAAGPSSCASSAYPLPLVAVVFEGGLTFKVPVTRWMDDAR
jgi:hypothetical protein